MENTSTPSQLTAPERNPLFVVTPLSKYLALVLFVTLPFAGFFVGMYFGIVEQIEYQADSQTAEQILSQTTDDVPSIDEARKEIFNTLAARYVCNASDDCLSIESIRVHAVGEKFVLFNEGNLWGTFAPSVFDRHTKSITHTGFVGANIGTIGTTHIFADPHALYTYEKNSDKIAILPRSQIGGMLTYHSGGDWPAFLPHATITDNTVSISVYEITMGSLMNKKLRDVTYTVETPKKISELENNNIVIQISNSLSLKDYFAIDQSGNLTFNAAETLLNYRYSDFSCGLHDVSPNCVNEILTFETFQGDKIQKNGKEYIYIAGDRKKMTQAIPVDLDTFKFVNNLDAMITKIDTAPLELLSDIHFIQPHPGTATPDNPVKLAFLIGEDNQSKYYYAMDRFVGGGDVVGSVGKIYIETIPK